MTGKQIAFTGTTTFRRGDEALRDVIHIDKIVRPPDHGGEFSVNQFFKQTGKVAVQIVVRSDDAGGLYDHGVKALLSSVKDKLGCHGLRFCVVAEDKLGIVMIDFFDLVIKTVGQRQCVHGAAVQETLGAVLFGHLEHVFCALDIHFVNEGAGVLVDRDQAGQMQHHDVTIFEPRKKHVNASRVGHIAGDNLTVKAHEGGRPFFFQHESANPLAAL